MVLGSTANALLRIKTQKLQPDICTTPSRKTCFSACLSQARSYLELCSPQIILSTIESTKVNFIDLGPFPLSLLFPGVDHSSGPPPHNFAPHRVVSENPALPLL